MQAVVRGLHFIARCYQGFGHDMAEIFIVVDNQNFVRSSHKILPTIVSCGLLMIPDLLLMLPNTANHIPARGKDTGPLYFCA
jgi:hypothetical protein